MLLCHCRQGVLYMGAVGLFAAAVYVFCFVIYWSVEVEEAKAARYVTCTQGSADTHVSEVKFRAAADGARERGGMSHGGRWLGGI